MNRPIAIPEGFMTYVRFLRVLHEGILTNDQWFLGIYGSVKAEHRPEFLRFIGALTTPPVNQDRVWRVWKASRPTIAIRGPANVVRFFRYIYLLLSAWQEAADAGRFRSEEDFLQDWAKRGITLE